jgi:hypothetical protein
MRSKNVAGGKGSTQVGGVGPAIQRAQALEHAACGQVEIREGCHPSHHALVRQYAARGEHPVLSAGLANTYKTRVGRSRGVRGNGGVASECEHGGAEGFDEEEVVLRVREGLEVRAEEVVREKLPRFDELA